MRVLALTLVAACGGAASVTSDAPTSRPDSPVSMSCGSDMTGSLTTLMQQVSTAIGQRAGAASNALVVPSAADRDAFAATVQRVLDGSDTAACALPPSYQLVRLHDPAAGALRVVVEMQPALFYGTYAANPTPTRQLAIEAPHPIFDTSTELQATAVFVQAGARYLLVAGSHRCADTAASPCSGTTTACGASEPYRISDAAHADALPFYAIHAALSLEDSSLVFLQLHGNSQSGCPDALVSDSSGAWNDADPAGKLAAALVAHGVAIGKCGSGFPTSSCNLCGIDNVEARETAGSSNACTLAGATYGRFMHVEQHLSLRTAPFQTMVDAVEAAFP